MLKEIHEQPDALRETIGERLEGGEVVLDLGLTDEQLLGVDRVSITACGTACHAGMVGRLLIEEWARMPVDIEYASEFRYRFPVLDAKTLAISVSQSGETADTIAAQRVARESGALTLAISNHMGSQLTREADGTLYTRSGREICVAATKTFTSQIMAFTLLALHLAELRGTLAAERIAELRAGIDELPELAARLLADGLAGLGADRRDRRPSSGRRSSSSTSAAISACRCASRARSSSRRSATSRPTRTPPAR